MLDPTLPWRCPTCGRAATVHRDPEPSLQCDDGHVFGSVNDVLCLCETQNYADSFGAEWLAHAHTQVDKFNGTKISYNKFFQYTQWPHDLRGQTILEAGSGSGRFTEVLLDTGAKVVSFDYSGAVVANAQNNAGTDRLTLFRGDIYKIPFKPKTFDRVVCIGVLQHTPDPEASFHALVRMLKPGGRLAADIYRVGAVALFGPKYYLRPFRRLVPQDKWFSLAKRLVPALLPIKAALRKIPIVGVPLGHLLVPVADYRGRLPLSDEQVITWSELEFVDHFTPEHDHPVTRYQVERWCRQANLVDVDIEVVSKGGQFAIRARAPE